MHPIVTFTLLALAIPTFAASALAATFTVNSTDDTTDGTCGAVVGGCTLREAMEDAVATPGRDTIAFDPTIFPLGGIVTIGITAGLPTLVDSAGTAIDGTGASVRIAPATPAGQGINPLVFRSAGPEPLTNVAVTNITVSGFEGTGIIICGGVSCDADVTGAVVQNVFVTMNGAAGVRILGRVITKARVVDSVAVQNGLTGFELEATESLVGARIEGCTARDNGMLNDAAGIRLNAASETTDTLVVDSHAVHNNGTGIEIDSGSRTTKTKLTNVTVVRNKAAGIVIASTGDLTGTSIANAVASNNMGSGISAGAGALHTSTTLKDVAANGNAGKGISLGAEIGLSGAKISNTTAARNQGDGIFLGTDGSVSGNKITRVAVTGNGGVGLNLMGSQNVVKSVRADVNGAGILLAAPGGGNKIEKCSTRANNGIAGGFGISVAAGNTGNLIQKNAAHVNDGFNLDDGNPNCDGNDWKKNIFTGTNSAPCIQ